MTAIYTITRQTEQQVGRWVAGSARQTDSIDSAIRAHLDRSEPGVRYSVIRAHDGAHLVSVMCSADDAMILRPIWAMASDYA